MADSRRIITVNQTRDADSAFMFYALSRGHISHPGYIFKHELSELETLNQNALSGESEFTSLSVHAYAYLQNRYSILSCGASMGNRSYGPKLVSKLDFDLEDGLTRRIAIPGQLTSSFLALQLWLHQHSVEAEFEVVPPDQIIDVVKSEDFEAGLMIHEDQLSHIQAGLHELLDLGRWWWDETKFRLPLGICVVNKELGKETMCDIYHTFRASIEYGLMHREQALDYAWSFSRGLEREETDQFVGMYVDDASRDLGQDGKESIRLFLYRGMEYGLIPEVPAIDFIPEEA